MAWLYGEYSYMTCNMGKTDRIVRAIVGVAIIGYGIFMHTWWGAIGAIPLVTALAGWCPAYLPFNISTRKRG